jgi:effector-binding domain-containing protein/predicted DNA-binding WGR domain protein
MGNKVHCKTNNRNALVNGDVATGATYLKVLDCSGNYLELLIEKECWLECHDFSVNAHKYYEIIETVGGYVVAFWGRIFKDGAQSPKFGEIKNISYTALLNSKTNKKDYKIMTQYERDAAIPSNYYEPSDFNLVGIRGQSTPAPANQNPVSTATPVSVPTVPESRVVLTDSQKIILQKLEQLESFAEEICKKLSALGIKTVPDGATDLWNGHISIVTNNKANVIKNSITVFIGALEDKGIITKDNLELCNIHHKELTKINETYKRILQIIHAGQ